jgi:AcrR family transcriptional regulator
MKAKSIISKAYRTREKAKITRNRLKKAALDIFSEKSIDSATVEEITEKADVGKGTLYQHFADKDDIVVSLVDDAINNIIERIRDYQQHPPNLGAMLEHLLNIHYAFSIDSKEEFFLLFQGKLLLKLQSEKLDELEEPYLRYLGEIQKQISTCVSSEIDPIKLRRLACAVAGFVFGFFSFAMIGMTESEIEKSMSSLRQVFINSLCVFLER